MKILFVYPGHISSFAAAQRDSLIELGIDIREFSIANPKSFIDLIKYGFRLRNLVRANKISIVHAQWGTSTGLLCSLFSPVPVVVSFGGSDLLGNYDECFRHTVSGKISGLLSQMAAIFSTSVIVKSALLKGRLWKSTRGKAWVIPNGVDIVKFRPLNKNEAKMKLNWTTKYNIIYFHRKGAWVKNPALALMIADRIKERCGDCELRIIENVPHDELVYYYSAADLLLITSLHEGSNNSTKEAMACNTPILSTRSGDAVERLTSVMNSHLFTPKDIEDAVRVGSSLILNNERSNGRQVLIEQKITRSDVALKIKDQYDKIVWNQ